MTSFNHAMIGCGAAIVGSKLSLGGKAVVAGLLVASHLALDSIPHCHYRQFMDDGQSWEVLVAMIALLVVWVTSEVNPLWLLLCVGAANAVDAFTLARIVPFPIWDYQAHQWWASAGIPVTDLFRQELAQTFVITGVLSYLVVALRNSRRKHRRIRRRLHRTSPSAGIRSVEPEVL